MSEDSVQASTERAWLAVLLLAEGHTLEEIARQLPRVGPGGRRGPSGSEGVSRRIASSAVRAGVHLLLGHVMRDEPPPARRRRLWPPGEVRETVRALRREAPRLAALRHWLRGAAVDDGLG